MPTRCTPLCKRAHMRTHAGAHAQLSAAAAHEDMGAWSAAAMLHSRGCAQRAVAAWRAYVEGHARPKVRTRPF